MIPFIVDFTDNLNQVHAHLNDIVDSFRADDGPVAEDVQDIFAEEITAQCDAQMDPEDNTWAENEPAYAERKGGLPVGVLSGDMLSRENLKGNLEVSEDTITITYAGNEFDQQKLVWFEASGRKVWGWNGRAKDRISDLLQNKLSAAIHGG